MDSVATWLTQVGLGQYSSVFAENGIKEGDLQELTENELAELGLTLGHREMFRAEIEARSGDKNFDLAILFVHGIGQQGRGETLVTMGEGTQPAIAGFAVFYT